MTDGSTEPTPTSHDSQTLPEVRAAATGPHMEDSELTDSGRAPTADTPNLSEEDREFAARVDVPGVDLPGAGVSGMIAVDGVSVDARSMAETDLADVPAGQSPDVTGAVSAGQEAVEDSEGIEYVMISDDERPSEPSINHDSPTEEQARRSPLHVEVGSVTLSSQVDPVDQLMKRLDAMVPSARRKERPVSAPRPYGRKIMETAAEAREREARDRGLRGESFTGNDGEISGAYPGDVPGDFEGYDEGDHADLAHIYHGPGGLDFRALLESLRAAGSEADQGFVPSDLLPQGFADLTDSSNSSSHLETPVDDGAAKDTASETGAAGTSGGSVAAASGGSTAASTDVIAAGQQESGAVTTEEPPIAGEETPAFRSGVQLENDGDSAAIFDGRHPSDVSGDEPSDDHSTLQKAVATAELAELFSSYGDSPEEAEQLRRANLFTTRGGDGWKRRQYATGPDGRRRRYERGAARIGDLITREIRKQGWGDELARTQVMEKWRVIVGPYIAQHTELKMFKDATLYLECDSTSKSIQLRYIEQEILDKIASMVGPGIVTKLRIYGPNTGISWRFGPRHVRGRGPRDTYG